MDPNISINQEGPKGFVWEATKGDRKVYLTGSLRQGIDEIPASLSDIVGRVRRVYFETKPSYLNNKWLGIYTSILIVNRMEKLEKVTEEERSEEIQKIIDAVQVAFDKELHPNFLERMSKINDTGKFLPAAISQFVLSHIVNVKFPQKDGLQQSLLSQCKDQKKKVSVLNFRRYFTLRRSDETFRQIRRIHELKTGEELAKYFEQVFTFFQELWDAYQDGDIEKVQAAQEQLKGDSKGRSEQTIKHYRKLVGKIERIAKNPALIVYDVRSFPGENGVLDLLQNRGWQIEQVVA